MALLREVPAELLVGLKAHNLQTHVHGGIRHAISSGQHRNSQVSRQDEMQGIERAESLFWITRDQIGCFGKARIIHRVTLQRRLLSKERISVTVRLLITLVADQLS